MPKSNYASGSMLTICAQIATSLFNEGSATSLKIFEAMGVQAGAHPYNYVTKRDSERISRVNFEAKESTKKACLAKKRLYENKKKHILSCKAFYMD